MTDQTAQIRRLNDMTRTQPSIVGASWVMTSGVAALMISDDPHASAASPYVPERLARLRAALAYYCDWREGNDPYGEHDFGAFELFGARLFFKIDYFHPDHDTLSPVPSSVELCRRVLTIMLAEEY